MMLLLTAAAAVAAGAAPIRILSADGAPVSVELVASSPGHDAGVTNAVARKTAEPMPNLYQVPARCRDVPYHVVDQYGRPIPRRLGDLPNAGALQLLVDRNIDGCRVITVKQGVVPRDEPNPPAESYQIRPLKPQSPKAPPR